MGVEPRALSEEELRSSELNSLMAIVRTLWDRARSMPAGSPRRRELLEIAADVSRAVAAGDAAGATEALERLVVRRSAGPYPSSS
jgi:hypothetical protein